MKIFEIQSQLTGEVIRRYDTLEEADHFINFFQDEDDPIRITVRDLNPFEILTMPEAVDTISELEGIGVSRAAISRALGVSRHTVNNWKLRKSGRLKPSQMLVLSDLRLAFCKKKIRRGESLQKG